MPSRGQKKRDLLRAGQLPPIDKSDPPVRQAMTVVEHMKMQDKVLQQRREAGDPEALASDGYGEQMFRLSGLSLDVHERILKANIPFTKRNLAMIKTQQDSANAILRTQARVQANLLERARIGMIPNLLRDLLEVKERERSRTTIDGESEEVTT